MSPAEPLSDAEIQESTARVQRGGLPLTSERRLRELSDGRTAFTSDLSVGGFALCDQLQLRPVGQVMGSSIYQVGYQSTPWPALGGLFMLELDALSASWNEARELALGRLAQEAELLRADAVVGVQLRTGAHDWAENSIEYMVLGTAVRRGEGPGDARPVLTELSVADYSQLARAGIEPLGIVAWSSVFFVAASYATQTAIGLGGLGFTANQELPEFTQGVYNARETVVQRMTRQAQSLNADGVIGVRIAHAARRVTIGGGRYERGGLEITFHAIGTAIRQAEDAVFYPPETTVDLTA
jgi:uncharacterized protein YbjQ (UPF0145 family)